MIKLILTFVLMIACSWVTLASESDILLKSNEQSQAASSTTGGTLAGRAGLALFLVTGLGIAAWIGLKRYQFKNSSHSNALTKIKILNTHHLGPKKQLTLIRVAGETILIGVTDHSIQHIKTLSIIDDEVPDRVPSRFQVEANEEPEGEVEDFSMAGIGELVKSKLQNMRKVT